MKVFSAFSFSRLALATQVSLLLILALASTAPLQAQSQPATPNMFATLAGIAGSPGANDGNGRDAGFSIPQGLTVDGARNVYVADSRNHTIRKITPAGVVSTLAGTAGQSGSADGIGHSAAFDHPASVAVDAAGNVYVADQGNSTIRKISPAGAVTTLAGSAQHVGSNDGVGGIARFNNPLGVAVDHAGNVYVADSANHTIRKVTPAGEVTTLAGQTGHSGSSDGLGCRAQFAHPRSLSVDAAGNVLVADSANHTIRTITPAGEVTTLAGRAGVSGASDGLARAALFTSPSGVAADAAGNVYVADTNNHTIRKISSTGKVTTIAGAFINAGSADGEGCAALFNQPGAVAVNAWGDIYVADTGNHTIREGYVFHPAPIVTGLSAAKQVLAPGQGFSLSVSATGTGPLSYQWYHTGRPILGATAATISNRVIGFGDNGDYSVAVTDDLGTNQKSFFVGVASAVSQVRTEQNQSAL